MKTVVEYLAEQNTVDGLRKKVATVDRSLYRGVRVKAHKDNTEPLFVGGSTVKQSSGFRLDPAEEVLIEIDQLSKVWIIGDPTTNEQQTVSIDNTANTGTFTLTYGGQTTGNIAYDASAGAVESALEALSTVGSGNVSVTGGPGPSADWVVEFTGELAGADVALMTGDGTKAGINEQQTVNIDNLTSSGTFTLTYESQTTDPISYNADAAAVESALEALSTIGSGNVSVSGGPGPTTDWVVTFQGALGTQDVNAMTGDGANLVGGSTTVTITETVAGLTATIGVTETVKGVGGGSYSILAL